MKIAYFLILTLSASIGTKPSVADEANLENNTFYKLHKAGEAEAARQDEKFGTLKQNARTPAEYDSYARQEGAYKQVIQNGKNQGWDLYERAIKEKKTE